MSPVRFLRVLRGMSRRELAERVGNTIGRLAKRANQIGFTFPAQIAERKVLKIEEKLSPKLGSQMRNLKRWNKERHRPAPLH